jgi:hypothetical protein
MRRFPRALLVVLSASLPCAVVTPRASADFVLFDTGAPDGRMATASTPSGGEVETADDFIATSPYTVSGATFTGLITNPNGGIATVNQVVVEIYRVFPNDSTVPPSGNVPTRVNSPSDVAFLTRDSSSSELTFSTTTLNPLASAANSVTFGGIHPIPGQTTGGEGAVRGQEVQFSVSFNTPLSLPPDHYFFVPQVSLTNGAQFLWLSAARPIVGGTGPFLPDLQSWIRNSDLEPDWLRIGTDVVGPQQGVTPTFNASFSLVGVPEPSSVALTALGLGGLLLAAARRRRRAGA